MTKRIVCSGGRVVDLTTPVVMGILNITPDSFYDGGSYLTPGNQLRRAEKMLKEGAAILDIGAVSTRQGAASVDEEGELGRILPALKALRGHFPACVLSVDTFRPLVARAAADHGADIINDIYGGRYAPDMLSTIAALKLPYILMHMKGTPENMQHDPVYSDVVAEVTYFFEHRIERCREEGITQVIADPGFGFGKTVDHNFQLLAGLNAFQWPGVPLLAGLSRKSMINRSLGTHPDEALNGTTVVNTLALMNGADILRVHDVKEAVEAVRLVEQYRKSLRNG